MTVSTLRPTSEISRAGSIAVGGASNPYDALADESDTTFLQLASTGARVRMGMGNLTLPAGAIIRTWRARVRQKKVTLPAGDAAMEVRLWLAPSTFYKFTPTSTVDPTTVSTGDLPNTSDAEMDALEVECVAQFATVNAYALYIDVYYALTPTLVVSDPTGTLTTTNQPLVEWTPTLDVDGGPQTSYEVKIFELSAVGNMFTYEEGIAQWQAQLGATLFHETVDVMYGSGAIRCVTAGAAMFEGFTSGNDFAEAMAIVPGTQYTLSVHVKYPVGEDFTVFAGSYNAANSHVANVQDTFTGTGAWQRVAITFTAAVGAVQLIDFRVMSRAAAATKTFRADAWQLDLGPVALPYAGVDATGGFDVENDPGVYESGKVLSADTSHAVTATLPDGSYRAYVRVGQTVVGTHESNEHYSAWAYSAFTIDVAIPDPPLLTVTAQSAQGRIEIELDDAGAVTTDRYELQRSRDGGATWEVVRIHEDDIALDGGAPLPGFLEPGGPHTVYDYEAPQGTATQYRARALHNYGGEYAGSEWSDVETATWSANAWWLKHPAVPSLNMLLTGKVRTVGDVVQTARLGIFQPLGAVLPIVVSDTRGGPTGTLELQFDTVGLQQQLDELLNLSDVLLIQPPPATGLPQRYVRLGDHTRQRVEKLLPTKILTREQLAWIEVSQTTEAQTGAQFA